MWKHRHEMRILCWFDICDSELNVLKAGKLQLEDAKAFESTPTWAFHFIDPLAPTPKLAVWKNCSGGLNSSPLLFYVYSTPIHTIKHTQRQFASFSSLA